MAPPGGQVGPIVAGGHRRLPASTNSLISTGIPGATLSSTGPPPTIDILECPSCEREFSLQVRRPQVLSCGHTVCELCSATERHRETCNSTDQDVVSENLIILQLLGEGRENNENLDYFISMAYRKICTLATLLRPSATTQAPALSRPMLRKLLAFVNSNIEEPFGLHKALKAARSLAERSLVEVILEQQSSGQLTASLWAAVRARGCQFLGPAMQEEVLKLVLLALEDGSALSRKVLVMFVVQRLSTLFPHASKTSIGHVVQLLYRASCFVVAKRDGDSSLMQLKEEFRTYEALRREHDAQIVSIACEAGLRIAPEQWSSLLYGDGAHRSHMQSIIDRLQAPQSLEQTARELASLASRANDLPLASLLQLLQQPLKVLEWQPEEVASSGGGKAVFDFISAAVSTVHCCLSLLQQQQHQANGHGKANGPPSPTSIHPFQQQQLSPPQQQTPSIQIQKTSSSQPFPTNSSTNNNIKQSLNEHLNNINSNSGAMAGPQVSHIPPHPAYKYKVNLCRDMNNFGVCPRGAGCTFAHSTREQEHFRMRGKQQQNRQQQQTQPGQPAALGVKPSQPTINQVQSQHQLIRPYHQAQHRYPAASHSTSAEQLTTVFHPQRQLSSHGLQSHSHLHHLPPLAPRGQHLEAMEAPR